MIEERVKVNRKRDFSDVLNASFGFIKQEYKSLFRMLFLYAGIPVLAVAILNTIYVQNPLSEILNSITDPQSAQNMNSGMEGKAFLVNLITNIVNIFLTGLTYCYIVLYTQNESQTPDLKEVWHKFTSLFAPYIGYNILSSIVIILAFIAIIIPGIYVMVPLSFILIIKTAENESFGESWNRCFALVKNHWWESFGLIIIGAILIMVIAGALNLPASSYVIAEGLLSQKPNISTIPFVLTSFFSTIGTSIITPIPSIILAFQYYSLVEHKDNTSLLDRIEQINKPSESDDA
ncbi:hypothetical protein E9993_03265 [Labilibacter sediminis]|nr:hypothetical protein E9993_03265 [Labilibacter sediminis]